MTLYFTVTSAQEGKMLRDILRRNAVSTTLMRQVKQQGGFFCNDVSVHTNACAHAGDVISFALPPEEDTTVVPENLPLDIVFENEHAMVLNKNAGQTVHPTRGYVSGTLANAFCGEMQRRGQHAVFRPVNRIDRNTSGLVLCAMDAYAAPLLAKSVQKIYYAIAQGEMPLGAGSIEAPIALCADSLIKRCVAENGKPSRTDYTVLAVKNGLSLVACVPVTGRTHQIRVHLAFAGHPLAGDDLYGGSTQHIQRHALHCGKICFTDFTNQEKITIAQAFPQDMAAIFDGLQLAKI